MKTGVKGACGILLVGLLSCGFVFGYDLITQCEFFKARHIEITGVERLSRKDVMTQAKITDGVNILSVNLKIARKRLLSHPWIKDARVSRELPSELTIGITEHQAVAIADLGEKFLVNTGGEIFKRWEASDPDQLPIISGLDFSDIHEPGIAPASTFQAAMAVLQLGRQPGSILPNRMIKKIQVDRELGITLYAFEETKAIRLGYSDYPGKYQTLEQIFSYVKQSPEVPDFMEIDLDNRDRVILRPVSAESDIGNHKEV